MSSLTQSWTLDSSNNDAVDDIQQLLLNVPGHIFVSADPAAAFKLQVTTNTQAVLDSIQLGTELGSPLLQIGSNANAFNPNTFPNATFLAELTVPAHRLQGVECAGSGACVVGRGTHTIDQDLALKASGAGTLFVSTDDVSLRFATVENTGSGTVQWAAQRLAAQSLAVKTSGSGSVSIQSTAEIVPQTLTSQVDGTGSVYYTGSPLNVPTITSTVTGAGNITFQPTAITGTHNISVEGSGGVYAGSLVSQNTSVDVSGSGRVVVKALHALYTSGGGNVAYLDAAPAILESKTSFWNHGPVLTSVNYFVPFTTAVAPAHDAAKVGVEVLPTAAPLFTAIPTTKAVAVPSVSQGGPGAVVPAQGNGFGTLLWFLGGLGVAVVVVIVLLRRHIANKHKEYTPVK
ncbi:Aste57867_21379 [Aphanomyces stellatus]|uniref:Aste57867_21379 protein n=1 Tax=Aphanomyces stellatus TaxID=120398 RepID=A0A485LLY0_9STRA|nr:hypothetical protein As57867_021310 [Aphanomyces stellatus]VFT98051.1 Aste57867_21379 [Aphanomyces stellatus]